MSESLNATSTPLKPSRNLLKRTGCEFQVVRLNTLHCKENILFAQIYKWRVNPSWKISNRILENSYYSPLNLYPSTEVSKPMSCNIELQSKTWDSYFPFNRTTTCKSNSKERETSPPRTKFFCPNQYREILPDPKPCSSVFLKEIPYICMRPPLIERSQFEMAYPMEGEEFALIDNIRSYITEYVQKKNAEREKVCF